MASIEIKGGELIVHIHGWDKVLAMRGTLSVPLSHVRGARARPEEARFDSAIVESWSGVGTYVPGRYAMGTVQLRDGRSFFDVHDPQKTIAIDLEHDRLKHLVIEVDDETPEEAVARIAAATSMGNR